MKKFIKNKQTGFTMIELIVTVAVMALVSGVVLLNYNRFNSNILVENLAYEVALSIRQAQFFGWHAKEEQATNRFDAGYGVYFNSSSGNDTSFIIFADTYPATPNHIYDSGWDEIVDNLNMLGGNKIDKLCIVSGCSSTVNAMSVSFLRPDPDAYIREAGGSVDREVAEIHVISPKGTIKKVLVNNLGQISIE